jgi:hypothetical protein
MLVWLLAILLAWAWLAPTAQAAQSYDNCRRFIDSLPATISTQGVYCLRKDLATNLASGNAIEIQANNVTINCNDFKIGGLAAGDGSQEVGIHADGPQNVTVRHCNIRGFSYGMDLYGDGLLVEDNRLDNNLYTGIKVEGDRNLVRHNRIYATGDLAGATAAYGIYADSGASNGGADIIDNVVDGVITANATQVVCGIASWGANGTRISGNRIAGLALTGGTGQAYGIRTPLSTNLAISGNRIVAQAPGTHGLGIGSDSSNFCAGNTVANFATTLVMDACQDVGGNDSL